jgi:hypothetical protein
MLFNRFSERIKAASSGGFAGIPGGSTGDILVKSSGTDYDYTWTSAPGTFTISEGNHVYFAYVVDDIQINVAEMTATLEGLFLLLPMIQPIILMELVFGLFLHLELRQVLQKQG